MITMVLILSNNFQLVLTRPLYELRRKKPPIKTELKKIKQLNNAIREDSHRFQREI